MSDTNIIEEFEFGMHRLTTVVDPSDINIWTAIKWYVLKRNGDNMLLISKNCLAWAFYSGRNTLFEPPKPSSWKNSYIRNYLNVKLYHACFSDSEKQAIQTMNNDEDKLFILNIDELMEYMPEKSIWKSEILFADDINDRIEIWKEPSAFWINSVGSEPNRMCVMTESGEIYPDGIYTDADEIGVRPAMWVDYRKARSCNDQRV